MSADDDPARAAYARLLGAYAVGTEDALAAVVAPGVRYTIHGAARLSGSYRGVPGMLAWMRLAGEISEGTVRFTPRTVATDGDADAATVLVIGQVTAQRAGTRHETGHLYHLRWEGGLLVEGHTYPTDQRAFDALWT